MRCTFVLLVLASSCQKDVGSNTDKPIETTKRLAGVAPKQFDCGSIASPDALAGVLGGPTKAVDGPMPSQEGVAKPCNYEVSVNGTSEMWFFDFDCRQTYRTTAENLFKEYKQTSADQVAHYDQLKDAGQVKATDAGTSIARPSLAVEVQVGQRGLDHHGQGLLFIDDDAPCYVRVVGPDAARRLELAKLIAKNLTFANAPMTPRPYP